VAAGQLQHLALGDDAAGLGQDLQRLHRVGLDHQLEGPGEQEVADQHALRRAPDQVGRDLAAPQLAAVDHVVVQQGGGVDELDGGGQLQAGVVVRPGQARGGHGQQRTQALAAGGDQVLGQGGDDRHFALHARGDQGVDPGHVGGGQPHETIHRSRLPGEGRCSCVQNHTLPADTRRRSACASRPVGLISRCERQWWRDRSGSRRAQGLKRCRTRYPRPRAPRASPKTPS
jgi:hypothetical protein